MYNPFTLAARIEVDSAGFQEHVSLLFTWILNFQQFVLNLKKLSYAQKLSCTCTIRLNSKKWSHSSTVCYCLKTLTIIAEEKIIRMEEILQKSERGDDVYQA